MHEGSKTSLSYITQSQNKSNLALNEIYICDAEQSELTRWREQ